MPSPNTMNQYDLEERTFVFAKNVRLWVCLIPKTIANIEDSKQLIRSSGSVGANYIEGNEALGKKDFLLHLKISLKEAKESRYWLKLINTENQPVADKQRAELINEATEFIKIFSAITTRFK